MSAASVQDECRVLYSAPRLRVLSRPSSRAFIHSRSALMQRTPTSLCRWASTRLTIWICRKPPCEAAPSALASRPSMSAYRAVPSSLQNSTPISWSSCDSPSQSSWNCQRGLKSRSTSKAFTKPTVVTEPSPCMMVTDTIMTESYSS